MSKITPGPWTIESKEKRINTTALIISASDGLGPVAFATKANACAIAALPDLLEAAKNVLWKLNHNGDPDINPGPVKIDRDDVVIRHLQAALAKAEGKECGTQL